MDTQAASAYFLLLGSLLYSEPSMQDIEMLKEQKLFKELPYAATNQHALEGQRQMNEWLAGAPTESLVDAARSDWLLLLMGVGEVLAPPWGSVYLDKEKLLFTEYTLFVRRYYEHYGFMLKKKYSEPDDHLGLELEFIANLLGQGEVEAARDFTQKYLQPWIGSWANDVQKHARTDFYRALANLAVGGVQNLMQEIDVI